MRGNCIFNHQNVCCNTHQCLQTGFLAHYSKRGFVLFSCGMRDHSALSHSRFPHFLAQGRQTRVCEQGLTFGACLEEQAVSQFLTSPSRALLAAVLLCFLLCWIFMVIEERAARSFYSPLGQTEGAKKRLDSAAAAGNPPSLILLLVFVLCAD